MSNTWIEEDDEVRHKPKEPPNGTKANDVVILETKWAQAIKTTSALFKVNVDDFPMEFISKGVRIIGTNKCSLKEPCHTLIKVLLPEDKLCRYHCGVKKLIAGVDSLKFHTALTSIKAISSIEIGIKAFDDVPKKMGLQVRTGGSLVSKTISLVATGNVTAALKTSYSNRCRITPAEFRGVCTEVSKKHNSKLTVTAVGGYINFTIKTDGLDYESNHEFGQKYPEDEDKEVFVCSNFMVRQIANLTKLAAYNRPITIFTNPATGSFKMKITTEVGTSKASIGTCSVYIRPVGAETSLL